MEAFLEENHLDLRTATKKSKVLVINTGGTFSFQFKAGDDAGHHAFLASHFLSQELRSGKYPSLHSRQHYYSDLEKNYFENAYCIYWIVELDPLLDSSNMEMSHWSMICAMVEKSYQFFDGFVIIHGTNTMQYTSSALSFMIKV